MASSKGERGPGFSTLRDDLKRRLNKLIKVDIFCSGTRQIDISDAHHSPTKVLRSRRLRKQAEKVKPCGQILGSCSVAYMYFAYISNKLISASLVSIFITYTWYPNAFIVSSQALFSRDIVCKNCCWASNNWSKAPNRTHLLVHILPPVVDVKILWPLYRMTPPLRAALL